VRRWQVQGVFFLILLGAALWSLWPSYRFYTLTPEAKAKLPPSEIENLQKRAINLGLDLKGGMYLLLEVEREKLKEGEVEAAVERAIQIIRNRIDQWGVFEPSIQKVGTDRILVQLPGVMDPDRAKNLIGKTALLEFRIVADQELAQKTLFEIDRALKEALAQDSTLLSDVRGRLSPDHPFVSLLGQVVGDYVVNVDHVPLVDTLLSLPVVRRVIPPGYEFAWGRIFEVSGGKYRRLFLLKKRADLTGAELANAYHTIGSPQDPTAANQPLVILEFTPRGSVRFERLTEENVNKRLAIVLDGVVQSAPVIRQAIRGGAARIEGIGSLNEARDLAVILRAGALPAPLRIIEERSVGPTLGKDSIQRGTRALVVGFLLVVVFIALYYRTAGIVADLALFLNLVLVLAALAAFHATLTLPGIAGLILTVGMAVDANVIIFERIREELRSGKTFHTALQAGYSRAFTTILDANLTTLIAALVLLRFGTGPIRGFATTLSIGIVASFLTAIYFTRWVFEGLLARKTHKSLAI